MRDATIRLGLALIAFGCSSSDAPVSTSDVDVTAPSEGVLSLTPAAVDFDDVAVGKLEVATVLASNTGDAAVDVAEIILSGSPSPWSPATSPLRSRRSLPWPAGGPAVCTSAS
jgi:hypothetical protein